MARDYFCCYHSYLKKTQSLSNQEVGRLFRALMQYSESGEYQELAGRESMAFDFIADDIDRAKKSYSKQCETNSVNGAKGGRGNKANKAKKATAFLESEKSHNEDENENENENKDKSPPNGGESARARVRGVPTLDDVRQFCRERHSCVNPERFFAYWKERDWQGVTDWRERIVSWEQNGIDRPDAHATPASYDIERAEQKARTTVPELRKRGTP